MRAWLVVSLLVGAVLSPSAPGQDVPFLVSRALLGPPPPRLPDQAFSLGTVPEDLNADGTVNAADLATFTADWKAAKAGGAVKARSDFNRDGRIDTTDSGRILQFVAYCAEHGAYTKPVGRAEIGAAGGKLEAPGFSLTVPKGAFSATASLVLRRLPRLPDAQLGCATDTYRVEGLPRRFARPLALRLQADSEGPASGWPVSNFTFVSHSEPVFVRSAGEMAPSHLPLPATGSGGWWSSEIPAPEADGSMEAGQAEDVPQSVSYSLFTHWRALTTLHFRIIFHPASCDESQAQELAKIAEISWSAAEKRFGMDWGRRTRYPIDVTVSALGATGGRDDPNYAQTSPSKCGRNYYAIEFNSVSCGSDAEFRSSLPYLGHEVFHLAQSLYDPRGNYAAAVSPGPWYWVEEATATHFEWAMSHYTGQSGTTVPIPSAVRQHIGFVTRHGLEYATGDRTERGQHGYGAAALCYQLQAALGGDAGIGELFFEHRLHPAALPCDALAKGLGGAPQLRQSFSDFVDQWVQGSFYPSSAPSFPDIATVIGYSQKGSISDASIGFTVTRDFPDLSALPIVVLRKAKLPPHAELWFSVTGVDRSDWDCSTWVLESKTRPKGKFGSLNPFQDFDACPMGAMFAFRNVRAAYPYTTSPTVKVGVQVRPNITQMIPSGGPPGTTAALEGWGFGAQQGQSSVSASPGTGTWGCQILQWTNTRVTFSFPDTKQYGAEHVVWIDVAGPVGLSGAAPATFTLSKP